MSSAVVKSGQQFTKFLKGSFKSKGPSISPCPKGLHVLRRSCCIWDVPITIMLLSFSQIAHFLGEIHGSSEQTCHGDEASSNVPTRQDDITCANTGLNGDKLMNNARISLQPDRITISFLLLWSYDAYYRSVGLSRSLTSEERTLTVYTYIHSYLHFNTPEIYTSCFIELVLYSAC